MEIARTANEIFVPARSKLLQGTHAGIFRLSRQGRFGGKTRLGAFEMEVTMPVLLLWAVPAIIVIGGGGYWLLHLH